MMESPYRRHGTKSLLKSEHAEPQDPQACPVRASPTWCIFTKTSEYRSLLMSGEITATSSWIGEHGAHGAYGLLYEFVGLVGCSIHRHQI